MALEVISRFKVRQFVRIVSWVGLILRLLRAAVFFVLKESSEINQSLRRIVSIVKLEDFRQRTANLRVRRVSRVRADQRPLRLRALCVRRILIPIVMNLQFAKFAREEPNSLQPVNRVVSSASSVSTILVLAAVVFPVRLELTRTPQILPRAIFVVKDIFSLKPALLSAINALLEVSITEFVRRFVFSASQESIKIRTARHPARIARLVDLCSRTALNFAHFAHQAHSLTRPVRFLARVAQLGFLSPNLERQIVRFAKLEKRIQSNDRQIALTALQELTRFLPVHLNVCLAVWVHSRIFLLLEVARRARKENFLVRSVRVCASNVSQENSRI